MTDVLLAMGGLLIVLVAFYYLGGHRRSPKSQPPVRAPRPTTPQAQLLRLQNSGRFRGVRIDSHCRASSHLVGRDYPFDGAPHLPVEGCDAAVCACGYIGLPDRRALRDRRRSEDRRHSLRMEAEERRAERPRRQGDLNAWQVYSHL
jgi:hypothetical protein